MNPLWHLLVFVAGGAGFLHRLAESPAGVLGQARVLGGAKDLVEVERAVPGSVLEVHAVASNHRHLEVLANLRDDVLTNNLTCQNIGAFHRLVSSFVSPLAGFRYEFSIELKLFSLLRLPAFFSRWRSHIFFIVSVHTASFQVCFLSSSVLEWKLRVLSFELAVAR